MRGQTQTNKPTSPMRATININLAPLPNVDEAGTAPFFPTYLLPYAGEQTAFYKSPSFSAISQQYDAFDVYITVLEVKVRQPDALPLAVPIEMLHRDLHWVYQMKGRLAVEPADAGAGRRFELATGKQAQVYSPAMPATLYLAERHTLCVCIAVKAKWLIRHQPVGTHPVEKLISFLRKRVHQCVASHGTIIDPAMPYLAELLSLPQLAGEPMDAAIAQPVGQLVRLARGGNADKAQNPDEAFVASICRQVDNHLKAGRVPSVAELAVQNGLSARSLGERYHTLSGHKLQTYMAKSRLAEGLRLMIEEYLTVGEAALAIGYAETSVFSK